MKRRPQYELGRLQLPRIKKLFDRMLREKNEKEQLAALINTDSSGAYEMFVNNVHIIARQLLIKIPARGVEEDRARQQYQESLRKAFHPQIIDSRSLYNTLSDFPRADPDFLAHARFYRRQYMQLKQKSARAIITDHLRKIESTSLPNVRLNETFKLIRSMRREAPATKGVVLTQRTLCRELSLLDRGMVMQKVPVDGVPVPSPPGRKELEEYFSSLSNGTAPGPDYLHNEFFAVEEVRARIADFIRVAYQNNQVPSAWHETTIFLLPKKKAPRHYGDFRPLTMCCTPYKIYTRYLLKELKTFMPRIPDYQNGFLENRSTDDNLFVIHRLLEEAWNHKQTTFMLSLDLVSAFSQVDLHRVPEVLQDFGAPDYLINRVIETVLYERTCISYQGQTTARYVKTLGVKQGCPFSPYLFVLVMHHLMKRVQERLRRTTPPIALYLGETADKLGLPFISAYADDLNLFACDLKTLEETLTALIEELSLYGLKINAEKSVLLVKTPNQRIHNALGTSITLGGLTFPIKDRAVVLGSRINSDMSRRTMIIDRCDKALKLYYGLLSLLKPQNLPFSILVRIYSAILVPIMTYGLRAVSFTKANKKILSRRELQMLRGFYKISYPTPREGESSMTVLKLLKGRSINRVLTAGRFAYYSHLCRAAKTSLLQQAASYRILGKRKLGRPCYTYRKFMDIEFDGVSSRVSRPEWVRSFVSAELTKRQCQSLFDEAFIACDPMPCNLTVLPSL